MNPDLVPGKQVVDLELPDHNGGFPAARAGPGMFAALPAPAGPAIQRYTGKPWPAAAFLL